MDFIELFFFPKFKLLNSGCGLSVGVDGIYVQICDYFSFLCIYSVVGINRYINVTSTVTIKREISEHKRKKMLSVYFFRIAPNSHITLSTSSWV